MSLLVSHCHWLALLRHCHIAANIGHWLLPLRWFIDGERWLLRRVTLIRWSLARRAALLPLRYAAVTGEG